MGQNKPLTIALLVGMGVMITTVTQSQALTIEFTSSSGVTAEVLAGFERAASTWENLFTDDVTVEVDIDYRDMGSDSVIGSAGSTMAAIRYSDTRAALLADQTSATDATASAHLSSSSNLPFLTVDSSNNLILDANNSGNNNYLNYTTANAKALGFTSGYFGPISGSDGSISFNNRFSFDFNPDDGISSGHMDFVGVATHELGHILGFTSGVDILDYYNSQAPGANNWDNYALFSVLDLYRYSEFSLGVGNSYGYDSLLDLATGDFDQFFSIDGGVTNLAYFSTGSYFGDGRQASHWYDHMGLGLMDPTAGYGELLGLTDLDRLAFDAIGWDLDDAQQPIPEPATMLLFGTGVAGLLGVRMRRKKG